MIAYLIETQQRHSHIRSLLPAVIDVLSIMIKKSLQLVIGGRLVEIIPLLCIMNSQPVSVSIVFWLEYKLKLPFIFVGNILICSKCTRCMQAGRIAGHHICRNFDTVDRRPLICPVFIHQGILFYHSCNVLLLATPWKSLVRTNIRNRGRSASPRRVPATHSKNAL
jgi:hypothetical protein